MTTPPLSDVSIPPNAGATPQAGQPALASDQAAARLDPTGFDQARRIAQLEGALRFYAEQWEQDVDAELTVGGWVGTIGQMEPTQELLSDAGDLARDALSEFQWIDDAGPVTEEQFNAAIAMEARQGRNREDGSDPKDDSAGRRHRPRRRP